MKLVEWQKNRMKDIVRLWNQELGDAFPMRKVLFEQNSFNDVNVFQEGHGWL